MADSRAMMVISVDNQVFGTKFISSAIRFLLSRHEAISVLIADELMIYNKFELVDGQDASKRVMTQYRTDRKRQFERIVGELKSADRIKVGFYDDFCDSNYARIFRRLILLALRDEEVFRGVEQLARKHFKMSETTELTYSRRLQLSSSVMFLLDETAWTINLSANHNITDNYYPGDVGEILAHFYVGKYGPGIFQILGVPRHYHRFWRLDGADGDFAAELVWQTETAREAQSKLDGLRLSGSNALTAVAGEN